MNQFIVNGIERESPVHSHQSFQVLLRYIRENLSSPTALVASIRVNGTEIGEKEEERLAQVRLSDLKSVEVTFAHPREIAEETLVLLRKYVQELADLSMRVADRLGSPGNERYFHKLLDGIQTLIDTVKAVKASLGIESLQSVDSLETDLLLTMRDLLHSVETKDVERRIEILRLHIPRNLEEWDMLGIPALIRARDS